MSERRRPHTREATRLAPSAERSPAPGAERVDAAPSGVAGALSRRVHGARGRISAAALGLGMLAASALPSQGCARATPPPPLKGQVHLTLIHTSDIHSRLFPYNLQLGQVDAGLGLGEAGSIVNVGGAARISYIVGRERARSQRVLHLDGGDCFQGAPIFNFYNGAAEIQTLGAMGADAMIVANHEFDKGGLNLGLQLRDNANFPVLAANYLLEDPKEPGASPLGALLQPFSVFNVDGLKVAVIGMGNLSSMTSIFDSPNRLGITPMDTIEVAQFYVDLLRPTVDVIVFVTHLGLENDIEMIERTTGIDVVLGGHNHIVLQPPKVVRDCARFDDDAQSHYIELNAPEPGQGDEKGKLKRFCRPRNVVLAHSGAFAKYVGRLDLVLSNDPADRDQGDDGTYDPLNGFEVVTSDFTLFPVNDAVPNDPIVQQLLEPYSQGLETLANLELLVGYARDGSRRFSTSGGDSALGNLVASAMWLRLGIQTDFSLTNTTGIRADLVPGPVSVEQMFNIFPFDNSISKMQLSGVEVQQLFDFVARRSAGRGCVSQVQIAGARVVIDCSADNPDNPGSKGKATHIYIGATLDGEGKTRPCASDADCAGGLFGSCDVEAGLCWQAMDPVGSYELATSNYLAGGGSGFRVLQRNTTQLDTLVQQRDALIDYIRGGAACGANDDGTLPGCSTDADCADVGEGFVCACPEAVSDVGGACVTTGTCGEGSGQCVLETCRDEVAVFQATTCDNAPNEAVKQQCLASIAPCVAGGEQCKFLACVDRRIGNFSDGRLRMVGQ